MTTYEVLMSTELLDQLRRDSSRLPAGFRIGEVTAQAALHGEPPSFRTCFVRVEDDDAPAELEGQLVTLTFRDECDDGRRVRTVILDRRIDDRAVAGYVRVEPAADAEWVECPACQGERGWMNYDTDEFDECVQCQGEGASRT